MLMVLSYKRMNESQVTPDTKHRLLDAARACVRDHGLAGATSRQITSMADANLAAITYHFGSKDELVAQALFADLERRVRPALDVFDGPGSPAELLARAVAQLSEEFERSRADTVLYLDTLLLATRDARYRIQALQLYRSLGTRLTALINDLIVSGSLPAWIDPTSAASLILAVANGIALQTVLDPDGPDHTAMGAQFASLLLSAGSWAPAETAPAAPPGPQK